MGPRASSLSSSCHPTHTGMRWCMCGWQRMHLCVPVFPSQSPSLPLTCLLSFELPLLLRLYHTSRVLCCCRCEMLPLPRRRHCHHVMDHLSALRLTHRSLPAGKMNAKHERRVMSSMVMSRNMKNTKKRLWRHCIGGDGGVVVVRNVDSNVDSNACCILFRALITLLSPYIRLSVAIFFFVFLLVFLSSSSPSLFPCRVVYRLSLLQPCSCQRAAGGRIGVARYHAPPRSQQ